jgi:hypothetical protein
VNLMSLRSLDLSSNVLTGELPALWGACTSLTRLDLSYNEITGSVPLGAYLEGHLEWGAWGQ